MTASMLSVVRIGSRRGGRDCERMGGVEEGSLRDSNFSSSNLNRCSVLLESSCTAVRAAEDCDLASESSLLMF